MFRAAINVRVKYARKEVERPLKVIKAGKPVTFLWENLLRHFVCLIFGFKMSVFRRYMKKINAKLRV